MNIKSRGNFAPCQRLTQEEFDRIFPVKHEFSFEFGSIFISESALHDWAPEPLKPHLNDNEFKSIIESTIKEISHIKNYQEINNDTETNPQSGN